MTAQRLPDLALAADIAGTGIFAAIGIIDEPSISLAAAILELENGQVAPYVPPVLIHALAMRISGYCIIESAEAESAAQTSLLEQIVMDWRISVPKAGALQALFVVKRLISAGPPRRFDLALQLAGKPTFSPYPRKELKES